jgi:hypothetical protein
MSIEIPVHIFVAVFIGSVRSTALYLSQQGRDGRRGPFCGRSYTRLHHSAESFNYGTLLTMGVRIIQVDAFTNTPFAGNPAAVCVLPASPSENWMQQVAREMNLFETAFLTPNGDGYNLRWFTPSVEVALCAHATVAGAHV